MPATTNTPQIAVMQEAVEYNETETYAVHVSMPSDGDNKLAVLFYQKYAGIIVNEGRIEYDKAQMVTLASSHPVEYKAAYDAMKALSYVIQKDEGIIPVSAVIT